MEALFEGRILVDHTTSCVYGETQGTRVGLVFEDGANIVGGGPLTLPNGVTVPLGEPVMLAGGYVTWGTPDERCPYQEYFVVHGMAGQ